MAQLGGTNASAFNNWTTFFTFVGCGKTKILSSFADAIREMKVTQVHDNSSGRVTHDDATSNRSGDPQEILIRPNISPITPHAFRVKF